ncbi:hypothetical protein T484DRAFT_1852630 [Baffinella frigidus]|nr:hypothetical protein T484DRAFT_1852630 [Cryptophyta sp. CCMP2293]
MLLMRAEKAESRIRAVETQMTTNSKKFAAEIAGLKSRLQDLGQSSRQRRVENGARAFCQNEQATTISRLITSAQRGFEMGRLVGPPLTESEQAWIAEQRVSPKSANELRVIDACTVAWLDLSGSGAETFAHIAQNGRLTIMLVALTGAPKILRLFGRGRIILARDFVRPEHARLREAFNFLSTPSGEYPPGFRGVVVLDIDRATSSCGFSIPFFEFSRERTTLREWAEDKGRDGTLAYRQLKNSYSIDGLPSIAQQEAAAGLKPVGISIKGGYISATEYGTNPLRHLYVRLQVACALPGAFLANTTQEGLGARDGLVFAAGALFAFCLMRAART